MILATLEESLEVVEVDLTVPEDVLAETTEEEGAELVEHQLRIQMVHVTKLLKSLFQLLNLVPGIHLSRLKMPLKTPFPILGNLAKLQRLITAGVPQLPVLLPRPLPPLRLLLRVLFPMVSRRVGPACLLLLLNPRK